MKHDTATCMCPDCILQRTYAPKPKRRVRVTLVCECEGQTTDEIAAAVEDVIRPIPGLRLLAGIVGEET